MTRKVLLGILLFIGLVGVIEHSDHLEGEDNPCSDPDNPLMVQRPITTIKGKVGDTVILPCSREDKMDLSHDQVEWFKDSTKENEPIHKYVWRGHAIQTQRDDLKGRTSLFEEELSSGDCSLSLTVTTSHSGSYYCCVPGRLYCPVNLEVLPAEEDDTSQMNRNDPVSPVNSLNVPDGPTMNEIVIIAAALLLVVIIFLVVFCYHKRRKHNRSGPNSNSPPTHPGVSYHLA